MRQQNTVGVERVQSIGSFPRDCLVSFFFSWHPMECSLFTVTCVIIHWAYTLITIYTFVSISELVLLMYAYLLSGTDWYTSLSLTMTTGNSKGV